MRHAYEFDLPTVKRLLLPNFDPSESKVSLTAISITAQQGYRHNADSSPRVVVVCLARTRGRNCCIMTVIISAFTPTVHTTIDLLWVHLVRLSQPRLQIHAPNSVNTSTSFSPCEHTRQRKVYLIRKFNKTYHSLRLPAPPPPYPALPTSGVALPTGLKLLNRLFFLLRSPLPIAGVSSPSP